MLSGSVEAAPSENVVLGLLIRGSEFIGSVAGISSLRVYVVIAIRAVNASGALLLLGIRIPRRERRGTQANSSEYNAVNLG